MTVRITKDQAPALGDVRLMGAGDTIIIMRDATQRGDWTRYMDAIRQAFSQGAEVRWPVALEGRVSL